MQSKTSSFRPLLLGFLLLIAIEASVRKFFAPTPLIILIKYPILILLALKLCLYRSKPALIMLMLSVPTLATIEAAYQLPYAVYDFVGIAIVPSIALAFFMKRRILDDNTSLKVIHLIFLLGFFNAVFIILQALLGPTHWLSQTVDQQFSQHVFGELQKAPGLQAVNPSLFSIAGLAAIEALKHSITFAKRKYLYSLGFLVICISPLFNLSSRTYAFSFVLFFLLKIFFAIHEFSKTKTILINGVVGILFLILLFILFDPEAGFSGFLPNNRTFDDFSSVAPRLFTIESIDVFKNSIPESLPLLNGLGLGGTVNGNPYIDPLNLPKHCTFDFGIEGEFPRLICAYGYYGYVLVLARIFLGILLSWKSLFYLQRRNAPSFIVYAYVSILILDGLQLKANDSAAGLLIFAVLAAAINTLNDQKWPRVV
jgi:hypothetical protein